MPRAAGKVAQADIDRYVRALAKVAKGPVGVIIRTDGTVEIRPVEEPQATRVAKGREWVP